jgi:hypothetical protein
MESAQSGQRNRNTCAIAISYLLSLWVYYGRMKSNPKSADEYTTFQNALRTVLQVSKTDLNRMLAEEKIANAGKTKRGPKPRLSALGHASRETD